MKSLILSTICSIVAVAFMPHHLSDHQVMFFTAVTLFTFFCCFSMWNPQLKRQNISIKHKHKTAAEKQPNQSGKAATMNNRNQTTQSAQMAAYKRWCVQTIGNTIIHEKLNVGLARTVSGPLTITFVLKLLQPNKTELDKLLSLANVFAQALQLEAVRLSHSGYGIALEIPSPLASTPNATALTEHGQGSTLCCGIDTLNEPVLISLRQHGAIGWVGPSRRGKTQSIKSCLYNLLVTNPTKCGS